MTYGNQKNKGLRLVEPDPLETPAAGSSGCRLVREFKGATVEGLMSTASDHDVDASAALADELASVLSDIERGDLARADDVLSRRVGGREPSTVQQPDSARRDGETSSRDEAEEEGRERRVATVLILLAAAAGALALASWVVA